MRTVFDSIQPTMELSYKKHILYIQFTYTIVSIYLIESNIFLWPLSLTEQKIPCQYSGMWLTRCMWMSQSKWPNQLKQRCLSCIIKLVQPFPASPCWPHCNFTHSFSSLYLFAFFCFAWPTQNKTWVELLFIHSRKEVTNCSTFWLSSFQFQVIIFVWIK